MQREWQAEPGAGATPERLGQRLREAFGLELNDDELQIAFALTQGSLPNETSAQQRSVAGVFGQLLGNHNGIGWTGVSHTQDLALVSALGPGAADFAGLLLNTEAFLRVGALLGVTHRNPAMTAEQARDFLAAAPQRSKSDWVA